MSFEPIMKLPKLANYITVPDYPPHCEICGYRGLLLADFLHTNYRGAIYECLSCDEFRLFIDQEHSYFSIDYWNMTQTDRKAYHRLSLGERRMFLKMQQSEQKTFIKLNREKRQLYLLENVQYEAEVEDYDNFVDANFYKYEEWQ